MVDDCGSLCRSQQGMSLVILEMPHLADETGKNAVMALLHTLRVHVQNMSCTLDALHENACIC